MLRSQRAAPIDDGNRDIYDVVRFLWQMVTNRAMWYDDEETADLPAQIVQSGMIPVALDYSFCVPLSSVYHDESESSLSS